MASAQAASRWGRTSCPGERGAARSLPSACSRGLLTALWSGCHLLPCRQVGFPGPRPACWPVPCVHSISHIGPHIAFLQETGWGGGGSCRAPCRGPHRVPTKVRVSSGPEGRRGLWGGSSSLLPPGAHMHIRMCTHLYKHTRSHACSQTRTYTHVGTGALGVFQGPPPSALSPRFLGHTLRLTLCCRCLGPSVGSWL